MGFRIDIRTKPRPATDGDRFTRKETQETMADSNIEYAIRRITDQAYLWDDDLDGRYVSWEDDEDNASWLDTEALALNLAELDGVAHEGADGPVLDEGYEVVSRQWRYEEDWTEED